MQSDEELVEEIKNGSQAAMEVLVKKHYNNIFAYMYRKLGDYHLAYDMTQEVFIKMMKYIQDYKGQGQFKHWLITIAVNHCRDYYRSSTYKKRNEEQVLAPHLKDEKENVWDLISKKIESEKVKEAVQQLPDFQKDPIILKFYHDLKIKEIAVITESNESSVKSRLKQGTEKLRKILIGGNQGEKKRERK